jgi:spore maturation protein CgeB
MGLQKIYDVMSVFTFREGLYPNRRYLQQVIENFPYHYTKPVVHDKYIKKINESKIFVTSNNIYSSLNMKYTEILSCGCLLLADLPEDLNDIGLKDGEHLIIYNGIKDLKSKIKYYLRNDKEREEIARNGMNLVREKHSNKVRIKEMIEIIKKEVL